MKAKTKRREDNKKSAKKYAFGSLRTTISISDLLAHKSIGPKCPQTATERERERERESIVGKWMKPKLAVRFHLIGKRKER
jgi:hypothetical protein